MQVPDIRLHREAARTITVGAMGRGSRQQFDLVADMQRITKEDLASMVRQLTLAEIHIQEQLGNPVQTTEADNRTNKPVTQAERKAVAIFGTKLAWAALLTVESVLQREILNTSDRRTGGLSDVGNTWEWKLYPRSGPPRLVTSESDLSGFTYGDRLVVYPVAAASYAWFVNKTAKGINKKLFAEAGRRETRKNRPGGFMGATAQAVRRNSRFKEFRVWAGFSVRYAVPHVKQYKGGGAPFICITPRTRQR